LIIENLVIGIQQSAFRQTKPLLTTEARRREEDTAEGGRAPRASSGNVPKPYAKFGAVAQTYANLG